MLTLWFINIKDAKIMLELNIKLFLCPDKTAIEKETTKQDKGIASIQYQLWFIVNTINPSISILPVQE
ncbi:hypothetical protein CG434_00800 [Pantoea ananatis]|jgi:hypothetical protein|nr:hypothetical protein CG434_00800 [Pantoea ananatis]